MLSLYEQTVLDFYVKNYKEDQIYNVRRQCVDSQLGVKRREETKQRMSLSQKGRPKPKDQVEKMRLSMIGKRHTEETKKLISSIVKGRPVHPNVIAALERSRHSPKRIAAAAAGRRACGYVHSQETKDKIAATLTGTKQTQEANDKRSKKMIGKVWTLEEIAKRVASRKANRLAKLAEKDKQNGGN